MFANVTLYADTRPQAIVVPGEAIVRSGNREQVFVVRAPGKYEPRSVTPGISADGLTQILSGLKAGEQVVTSGQFLIDSESKLREATAKMLEAMSAPTQNDHTGMNMDDMSMDDMDMRGMDEGNMSMEDLKMDHSGHTGQQQ